MPQTIQVYSFDGRKLTASQPVEKDAAEWKKALPADVYHVTREAATERAFTGAYWNEHREGLYKCRVCGNDLFLSTTKFESGTGWPSFWQPIHPANVATTVDRGLFMTRTEVHCARCQSHLGHVFEDGPKPTGLRYCMNSVALQFEPREVDGK